MSINDLPTDIIINICHEVLHNNNIIKKMKEEILDMITKNNFTISKNILNEENEEEDCVEDCDCDNINIIILSYIKNLTEKQKDNIICEYGMMKGFQLFYDYHRICLGDSYQDICECFEISDYGINDSIIQLIINDEIGFENNWRKSNQE